MPGNRVRNYRELAQSLRGDAGLGSPGGAGLRSKMRSERLLFRARFLHAHGLLQRPTGLHEIRLETQRFGELSNRKVDLIEPREGNSKIEVRLRVLRPQLDGLAEFACGVLQFVLLGKGNAQIKVGIGVFGL